jgi:hypothetical protein
MASSGLFALMDSVSRTRRLPTQQDTDRAIRLANALPEIDVMGPLAEPANRWASGRR